MPYFESYEALRVYKKKKKKRIGQVDFSGATTLPPIKFTTREKEGFAFPDYKVSRPGENLRADLNLINISKIRRKLNLDFRIISPSGRSYTFPQFGASVGKKKQPYGTEIAIPKNAETGKYHIEILQDGRRVLYRPNAITVRSGKARNRYGVANLEKVATSPGFIPQESQQFGEGVIRPMTRWEKIKAGLRKLPSLIKRGIGFVPKTIAEPLMDIGELAGIGKVKEKKERKRRLKKGAIGIAETALNIATLIPGGAAIRGGLAAKAAAKLTFANRAKLGLTTAVKTGIKAAPIGAAFGGLEELKEERPTFKGFAERAGKGAALVGGITAGLGIAAPVIGGVAGLAGKAFSKLTSRNRAKLGLGKAVGEVAGEIAPKVQQIEKPVVSEIPKVAEELKPLIKEARKYKNAEEFIKAQPKKIHFSDETIKEFKIQLEKPLALGGKAPSSLGEGIYLLSEKAVGGERFGNIKNDVFIDKTAKLLHIDKQITKEGVIQSGAMQEIGRILGIKKAFGRSQIPALVKKAGYDGIEALDQTVIYNPNVLKTKSQLTDIYNQTVKAEVTAKAPKRIGQEIIEAPLEVPELKPDVATIEKELRLAQSRSKGFIAIPRKGISEKILAEKGAEIITLPKKPILQRIMPLRELGKLDKTAGEIFEDSRNTVSAFEDIKTVMQEKMDESFGGLKKETFTKLDDLQEKGQLTDEVIAGLSPKFKKAAETLQEIPREIEKIAREKFGIDTSKWGYNEHNYFYHWFRGNDILRINGKVKAIGNRGVLLEKANQFVEGGVPPASISIKPKFMQEDIPTTLLSQKGFWGFVNKMADKLEITGDEVLNEIQGVVAIKPRPKVVGAFKQRTANLEGYEKDPRIVYGILWDRIQRKLHLEAFQKRATAKVGQIKSPWLKEIVEEHIKDVGGRYTDPEFFVGVNVNKVSQAVNNFQNVSKLGYRPSSALLNGLQPIQTALSELGGYLFKGYGSRYTKNGKLILEKLKLSNQRPKYTTGEIFAERSTGKPKLYKPLGLFSKVEIMNREATGIGAYLKAIQKYKLPENEAIQFAKSMVDATQFRYDISDQMKIMKSPLGKLALKFKTFPINYLYNVKNTLLGQPLGGLEKWEKIMYPNAASKVTRATTFLASNLAVGGLRTITSLSTPTGLGIVTYLAIKHPVIFQGALSKVGIDMSKRVGASPFEVIPDAVEDYIGPIGGDLVRMYKAITRKDYTEALKISPFAWSVYKALSKEETPAKPTIKEKILIAGGFEPSRLSVIKEGLRYLKYFKPEQRTKTGLPTERAVENAIYNLIERDSYDPRKKEVITRMLEEMNIKPDEFWKYLESRKERMRKARQESTKTPAQKFYKF